MDCRDGRPSSSANCWNRTINLFYRDVFLIHAALTSGDPMPEPILPYEEMLQTELDYVGSPRQAKDRAFWQAELEGFGGPPAYSNIDGTHARDRYRKLIRKPDHPFGSVIFLSTAASTTSASTSSWHAAGPSARRGRAATGRRA